MAMPCSYLFLSTDRLLDSTRPETNLPSLVRSSLPRQVCRLPYTSMLRVALPSSKPGLETNMAASHSTHSLHNHDHSADSKKDDDLSHTENVPVRSSSPVPTLPGRAESILYPDGPEVDEDEEEVAAHGEGGVELERPQFVLGAEIDPEEDEETRRKRVEKSA